jgi:thioredoxin 2
MSGIQLDERGLITVCTSCGQRNRIAFNAKETRCGRCKTPLPPPAEPVEVPDARAFDALVREAAQPIVVDFWAPWCGPCRMVAPELVRVAASNSGRLIVAKVNTDQNAELGERFRIRSIPTMAVFHGGKELARTAGAMPAAQIEAFVNDAVSQSRAASR